jgi:hypothetical protein
MSLVAPKYPPAKFSACKPPSLAYDGQALLISEIQNPITSEEMRRAAELKLAKEVADDLMMYVPIHVETQDELGRIGDSEIASRFEAETGIKPSTYVEIRAAHEYLKKGWRARATAREEKNMSSCKTLLWAWWVIETSPPDMVNAPLQAALNRIKSHARERFGILSFDAISLNTRVESSAKREEVARAAIANLTRKNYAQAAE